MDQLKELGKQVGFRVGGYALLIYQVSTKADNEVVPGEEEVKGMVGWDVRMLGWGCSLSTAV